MRTISMATLGTGLLLLMASPLAASEAYPADGVFCDTLEQAQAFLSAYDGSNIDLAIDLANKGVSIADGCGKAQVLIEETESYDQVANKLGTWQLVQVQVLAQFDQNGVHLPHGEPPTQYTARRVPGTDI